MEAAPFQLLIRSKGEGTQTALLCETRLIEYYEEAAQSLVGAIFLGRVERVLPDIKAAFVRIGLKQNGFLPLREVESFHQTSKDGSLMSGQEILVQVRKDPKGQKGAFLSRDISLPGQYALVMPKNRFIGLSKRIEEENDRKRAKSLGTRVADGRFGLIVRHAALAADAAAVREEAEGLWALWQDIEAKAAYAKAPLLMHREAAMAEILLRDYAARHPITVESEQERSEAAPENVVWRKRDAQTLDLRWRSLRIEEQLSQTLGRRVELKSGGSLIIDEREALHTIDVNSGSDVTASEGMSLALEENLAAVGEIARQIRLRGLSGIILVDFIDMDTDLEREQVLHAMEEALRDDRIKTVIHGFTRLGLMEMTRKRTRDTLRDALTSPCGACHETGRLRRG